MAEKLSEGQKELWEKARGAAATLVAHYAAIRGGDNVFAPSFKDAKRARAELNRISSILGVNASDEENIRMQVVREALSNIDDGSVAVFGTPFYSSESKPDV